MALNDRKIQILQAIINDYFETAEPVGSRTIAKKYNLGISYATIRNEMSDLEEIGLILQPHASAGRIPSDMGYRLYVDSLLERYRLTEAEIAELKQNLRGKQNELDSILDSAARLASRLTDYTALSLKPRQRRITVSRFEILPIDENTLVLVMIIGRVVKTKYIRSDCPVNGDAASRLSCVLNTFISGMTSSEITIPIMMEMERAMGEYEYLVSPVVKSVCELISSFDGGELKFDGINRLLSYPDYYDNERLREMLELFESKDDLLQVISEGAYSETDSGKVKIYIGRENLVKIMDNSTLIYKTIKRGDVPVGAIGIIGPTRMNYGRAIALIDHLSDSVAGMLGEGYDRGDNS